MIWGQIPSQILSNLCFLYLCLFTSAIHYLTLQLYDSKGKAVHKELRRTLMFTLYHYEPNINVSKTLLFMQWAGHLFKEMQLQQLTFTMMKPSS